LATASYIPFFLFVILPSLKNVQEYTEASRVRVAVWG